MIIMTIVSFLLYLAGYPKNITKEEAERIVLNHAKEKGYHSPELWCDLGNETTKQYRYSHKAKKDVETWNVKLVTSDHVKNLYGPSLIYYVRVDNGKIIDQLNAFDD